MLAYYLIVTQEIHTVNAKAILRVPVCGYYRYLPFKTFYSISKAYTQVAKFMNSKDCMLFNMTRMNLKAVAVK